MQFRKWGCGVVSPGRRRPPHVQDGLGCVNLDLKVKLFNVSACAEFADLVRSGDWASFKVHQRALVQDRTAGIKGRALTLGPQ